MLLTKIVTNAIGEVSDKLMEIILKETGNELKFNNSIKIYNSPKVVKRTLEHHAQFVKKYIEVFDDNSKIIELSEYKRKYNKKNRTVKRGIEAIRNNFVRVFTASTRNKGTKWKSI